MAMKWVLIKMVISLLMKAVLSGGRHHLSDTWVVQVKGGKEIVQLLAEQHNFEYLGEVAGFDDHYKLGIKVYQANSSSRYSNKKLAKHPMVVWAERQFARPRVKRDESRINIKDEKKRQYQRLREERKRDHKEALDRQKRGIFSWFWSRYSYFFNDALWSKQWYLQDYRTDGGVPVLDLNVVPCYARGVTGKGITISILDDGLEWTHPDLKENYEPRVSTDLVEGDRDPMPRYGNDTNNSHGTRCAGEIAMKANNNICGVGISFNAKVGGVKILDGPTTDVMEGSALIFAIDKVDIYSNSWGPPDDGKTVEAPGKIARNALHTGILKGRGGKGVIYVFAAGNGKSNGDNCACDGYINSIYTVPIASATQRGEPPFYGERCAAIFGTAYSSGNRADEKIATTDLNGACTTKHSGTSAAAPLAAGIFALTLQANPNLTWRCLQHLIVWTSEVAVLGEDDEWRQNKAGFWVNPNFGFGLLNAYNMVKLASNFKTVPEKTTCSIFLDKRYYNTTFDHENSAILKLETDGCQNTKDEINFLEHVQVLMNVTYPYRGAVEIFLTSPSGMKTTLLETRPDDDSKDGFKDWWITTVHSWGERPEGNWKVEITANGPPDYPEFLDGIVEYVHIVLHGTKDMPNHYRKGRRQYSTYDFDTMRV